MEGTAVLFAVTLIAGVVAAFFASSSGIAVITFVCVVIAVICAIVTGAFPVWYGIAGAVVLQVGYVIGILMRAAVVHFRRRS
jgi:hypothetical protein